MFIRSPFNYDRDQASRESGLSCLDASRTQQNFKDECDINRIMRKYDRGGDMPTSIRVPEYGDFTGIGSFHEAANALARANETFDALPAALRSRFQNSPRAFVEFCSDDKNLPEMVELGLAVKKQVPLPEAVPGGPQVKVELERKKPEEA